MIAILDKIKNEKKNAESPEDEDIETFDVPEDDADWEGDNPDEDIIYVK